MSEKLNYISDAELEQLILQVEQEELVAAPPDLLDSILETVGLDGETSKEPVQSSEDTVTKIVPVKPGAARKKEFYAYCFRVLTSVAAAIALVFLLPELSALVQCIEQPQKPYIQVVPDHEEVVEEVPVKEEVLAVKATPSKEDVLNGTGFLDKVLKGTVWFDNSKNNN